MQKSNFLEFEISTWLVTGMKKVICVIRKVSLKIYVVMKRRK